jgi:hypothetical protein
MLGEASRRGDGKTGRRRAGGKHRRRGDQPRRETGWLKALDLHDGPSRLMNVSSSGLPEERRQRPADAGEALTMASPRRDRRRLGSAGAKTKALR